MSYDQRSWQQNGGPSHTQQQQQPSQMANQKMVAVDVHEFIRTRDALASAYINLSSSFQNAVKAYLDHTQVVLDGDATLNVGHMLSAFAPLGAFATGGPAQMAQAALMQGNGAFQPDVKVEDPSKRKKRAYKPRDPNAPKRPLTAYFRYLGEVRNVISDDLQKDPDKYKDVAGQPGDISKIATAKWQRMNEDEKAPYKLAYQEELKDYTKKAEEYQKAKGLPPGSLPPIDADADADADVSGIVYPDVEESPAAVGAIAKVDGADDEDDDDDEDDESSDGDSSSSESEAEEDTPPPPPKAAATPKKSALKKKVSAAPQAPTAPQIFSSIPTPSFSSINNGPVAPAPEQMTSSPSRKRKADAPEKEGAKSTKRGKKVAAAAEPEPTPAPVVAPASPEAVPEASAKKKDKKKRKGKGDA